MLKALELSLRQPFKSHTALYVTLLFKVRFISEPVAPLDQRTVPPLQPPPEIVVSPP